MLVCRSRLFLTLLGMSLAWAPSGSARAEGVALSLPSMAHGAPDIFVGRLTHREKSSVTLMFGSQEFTLPTVRLQFRVTRWIRGGEPGQKTLVLHQANQPSEIEVDEEVLWYLSKEDFLASRYPLGMSSGHFQLHDSYRGKVALSLNENMLLWRTDQSVWENYPNCRRRHFIRVLEDEMDDPDDREYWLRFSDRGYHRRPLPLPFLVALTRACIPLPKPPEKPFQSSESPPSSDHEQRSQG